MFDIITSQAVSSTTQRPVELFLKTWLNGFGKRTARSYWRSLEDFTAFCQCASALDAVEKLLGCEKPVAAAILTAWRGDMRNTRGRAPSTCNVRMAAMRSMMEQARELDLITWTVKLKDFRTVAYRDTRGPGLPNIQKMLDLVGELKNVSLRARNTAILRLLFDLGLRGSEVCSLELGDFDAQGGRLWVLGKGHLEPQAMTLPEPTVEALNAWVEARGRDPGALFLILSPNKRGCRINRQTVYRLARELGEKVGVHTSPHRIRHTAVTTAASSLSLLDAQRYARHANPQTTLKYVDGLEDKAGKAAQKVASHLKAH